ncbi:3-oxoacyl-[acyl-carrier-protein] reductase [Aliikangiella maris]|uniref:3-oxoacyl-[acyl-carrier-protein] reductase n=2 Tax=Aliikangiella maris TaxID=3162458 RepID=A0ABV2BTZ0_9GAMM
MSEENQSASIAFVSGGSRGIGRAVAIQLAKDGFDIAFCYHSNVDAANEVKQQIESLGKKAYVVACDVSDYAAVKKMFEEIEENFGEVSVVVNNAGINADSPLPLMDPENWNKVINTNLNSVFNVCRSAALSFIRQAKGSIVNLSSVSGVYGNPSQTNYSAAKAGIIGFSKALAKEMGRYNVRVNVVAPGLIETDMTSGMTDKAKKLLEKKILLKRIGNVEDIAHAVSFLCSEKSSYMTGQILQIDGGITV